MRYVVSNFWSQPTFATRRRPGRPPAARPRPARRERPENQPVPGALPKAA